MGDILKIIRCGTISVQRGCDGCDRHPVSAMRAFDAVSADTRQLERHEQAIEILYQPPADGPAPYFANDDTPRSALDPN